MGVLDQDPVKAAMFEEMSYFCNKVWSLTTDQYAKSIPDATVTGGRWILCNNAGADNPKVRCRWAATEINT